MPDESAQVGQTSATPLVGGTVQATVGATDLRSDAEGWWALTDAGARVWVPASALGVVSETESPQTESTGAASTGASDPARPVGFRTLRSGQRVLLRWSGTPDSPVVDAVTLPPQVPRG